MAYAEGTTTSPEKSQMEIAAVVRKYGAQSFVTGWDGDRALVTFVAHSRTIRFVLHLPGPDDPRYAYKKVNGRSSTARTPAERRNAADAEQRRRWRALLIAIKAKFEVVESEMASFEEEFLSYTVLPSGRTVSEEILPRVEQAIALGEMPTTLLAIEAGR